MRGFTLLLYKGNTVQAEGPVSAKAPRPRCLGFEEWWRGRCDWHVMSKRDKSLADEVKEMNRIPRYVGPSRPF